MKRFFNQEYPNSKVRLIIEVDAHEPDQPFSETPENPLTEEAYSEIVDQLVCLENERLWDLIAKSREILRQRGEIID